MEPPQQQGEQTLYTQRDGAINPSSASGNPNGDFNMSADIVGSGSGVGADASNGVSDLAGLAAAKIGGKPPSEADKKAAPRWGCGDEDVVAVGCSSAQTLRGCTGAFCLR